MVSSQKSLVSRAISGQQWDLAMHSGLCWKPWNCLRTTARQKWNIGRACWVLSIEQPGIRPFSTRLCWCADLLKRLRQIGTLCHAIGGQLQADFCDDWLQIKICNCGLLRSRNWKQTCLKIVSTKSDESPKHWRHEFTCLTDSTSHAAHKCHLVARVRCHSMEIGKSSSGIGQSWLGVDSLRMWLLLFAKSAVCQINVDLSIIVLSECETACETQCWLSWAESSSLIRALSCRPTCFLVPRSTAKRLWREITPWRFARHILWFGNLHRTVSTRSLWCYRVTTLSWS